MANVGYYELQYQLRAEIDCRAIEKDTGRYLANRAEEVAKMIQGLIRTIKKDLHIDDDRKNANG